MQSCRIAYRNRRLSVRGGQKFLLYRTILGLKCNCNQMRHEFAPREKMSSFHRVDHTRARSGQPAETEARLTVGQSVVVIVGLSALSWAVLISIVVALRAVL